VPTVEQVLEGLDLRSRSSVGIGTAGGGAAADADAAALSNGACRDGRWFLSSFPFQIFTSFLGFVVRRLRCCHCACVHICARTHKGFRCRARALRRAMM
jgi:hypothetical protein